MRKTWEEEEVTEYLSILQITESSLPDDAAALRMAHLLKMAQDNNSSHVAVLDMLVEQFSSVNQQLAVKTIVRRKTSHSNHYNYYSMANISEGRPDTTKIGSSLRQGNPDESVNMLIR